MQAAKRCATVVSTPGQLRHLRTVPLSQQHWRSRRQRAGRFPQSDGDACDKHSVFLSRVSLVTLYIGSSSFEHCWRSTGCADERESCPVCRRVWCLKGRAHPNVMCALMPRFMWLRDKSMTCGTVVNEEFQLLCVAPMNNLLGFGLHRECI